jgi:hypothetical protein
MRAVGKVMVSAAALGAALMASGASAQVVTRSISEEPVETIVTQTPDGTIVTRRPLATRGGEAIDAITTREVVRRVERPVSMTTRTTVRKTARTAGRRESVTRTTRRVERPVASIALSPAERHIVYRTIVEREVVPAPRVVAPAYGVPAYGAPVVATPPVLAQDEEGDAIVTRPVYAVGSVLPANVPLYAVPDEIGYRVPAAQPYSYAYLGGRAYLVDPASGAVVADVTE